ncbi:DUF6338 family protein [Aquidulcibacter sp.]|uniref:DUF6338 family protein n=1 Tax=Aquidulcibacter sp. TaxID=2052990 RepID=UPI003BA504B9
MFEVPDASNFSNLAMLLAPGLVILSIRSRFKEGIVPDLKDRLLHYAMASTAYYAFVSPLFHFEHGFLVPPLIWSYLYYFIVPCLIAITIVFVDQKEWLYKIAGNLGLRIGHHIPAAWDYAFSNVCQETFLWVKLNSGTIYVGKFGWSSFASSNPLERDIYLQEVWKENGNGEPWTLLEPMRGVLLCGKDIQRIEIFGGLTRWPKKSKK